MIQFCSLLRWKQINKSKEDDDKIRHFPFVWENIGSRMHLLTSNRNLESEKIRTEERCLTSTVLILSYDNLSHLKLQPFPAWIKNICDRLLPGSFMTAQLRNGLNKTILTCGRLVTMEDLSKLHSYSRNKIPKLLTNIKERYWVIKIF